MGRALALFQQRFAKEQMGREHMACVSPFPFLEEMQEKGVFECIDCAVAERLMKQRKGSESAAAFICYLSLASRLGHLCVSLDEAILKPDLLELIQLDPADVESLKPSLKVLAQAICEGEKEVKDWLQTESQASFPIRCENNRYYFQRHWLLEKRFLIHLEPLLANASPSLAVDMEYVLKITSEMALNKKVLLDQRAAIVSGCSSCFSLITGGPGTGKTYTAGVLLNVLWQGMDERARANCRIALAAPTGKAAAQLEASIKSALGETVFPSISGETLHSLLGKGGYRDGSPKTLSADVLIVDESSMIDAGLMAQLMESIKPGSRLIMLGDRFQLPPVQAGSLFSDLVLKWEREGDRRLTELKTCMRAELQSIVDVAVAVKAADASTLFSILKKGESGVSLNLLSNEIASKEIQQKLLSVANKQCAWDMGGDLFPNPQQIHHLLTAHKILTPLRRGPLGADALNALLFEAALKSGRGKYFAYPILITATDKKLSLFNGEMGVFVKTFASPQEDYALFTNRGGAEKAVAERVRGEAFRKIPALLLPQHEHAFCLSIHKSQGSEYDHVTLLIPQGADHFGKEALYTGITRARKKLEIWSAEETLQRIVEKKITRYSGAFLGER